MYDLDSFYEHISIRHETWRVKDAEHYDYMTLACALSLFFKEFGCFLPNDRVVIEILD
mgnify:CR=1 FL=1